MYDKDSLIDILERTNNVQIVIIQDLVEQIKKLGDVPFSKTLGAEVYTPTYGRLLYDLPQDPEYLRKRVVELSFANNELKNQLEHYNSYLHNVNVDIMRKKFLQTIHSN